MWRWAIAGIAALGMALGAVIVAPHVAGAQQPGSGAVVQVPTEDAAMDAAIAKAKATLPQFFEALAAKRPGEDRFSVKIKYPTPSGGGEHIWAQEIVLSGDTVMATISNVPREIANLQAGQRVSVPVSQLTDWMYWRSERIVGGQTIRAILPRLSAEDAARYRVILATE